MTNEIQTTPSVDPVQNASPPPSRRFGVGALLAAVLVGSVTAGSGVWLIGHDQRAASSQPEAAPPKKVLYQCPMHPSVVEDHPGDCPICGMKLVRADLLSGDQKSSGSTTVDLNIDPVRQQLIGLRTTPVTMGDIGGTWSTAGRVVVDETRVRRVNVKIPGFVERVYVDFVGKPVKKGELLFTVYSPELLAAQEEYLLALRTRSALSKGGALADDGEALVRAARRKLELWDVPKSEIDRMAISGEATKTLPFVSPISGVVTAKGVVEGMKLEAGAAPYEIVDLSRVWVLADVYERELPFIKKGMRATLTLSAFPNQALEGKVLFIDPVLDPKTRTVKARLAFPNPKGDLRPEMFGQVLLHAEPRRALRIPKDAVIDSGTDKIVFVALGEGKFEPRGVRVGEANDSSVEIVSGLTEGEQVVARANFLIDSESKLRLSLAEMNGKREGLEGNAQ